MLILLLASLLGAWAVPISGGPETPPTMAHTIVWGIEARDGSGMVERTMLSIVRSCLLTVAACVYRAIHQNIPDPNASWWKRQAIRAKITFYTLMTPEVVIWWAMRQWIGAKEVAEQVNEVKPELKWTRTHGHFAQMGGFGRLDDKRILHPPTLIKLLRNGQIDVDELGRVTRDQINDSSKGDILSKGIVALQTTWFVFECVVRLHQKLPLLELEIITLAFAALNTLTYVFWWNKPLDVLCPIYLHILPAPETSNPSARSRAESPPWPPWEVDDPQTTAETEPLLDGDTGGDGNIQKCGWWSTTRKRLIKRPCVAIARPLWELLVGTCRSVWKVLGEVVCVIITGAAGATKSVGEWICAVHDDATHVSTFYGMEVSGGKGLVVWFLSCFIGVIFGAVHFLSWHSAFPTHTQLLLWRISSIVLVAEPEAVVSTLYIFFIPISILLGPTVYILARMALLVLAFLTLRNPPSTALQTISWTTYIPHL
ncbi:hypothetical protein BDN72DRAFT_926618 [Pluteus cervinus]|uniref:Uncharacterized protein n=1 Tax=Pluteus cervinus TaxID=181527 RepID=A0ACD3AEX5_9AGAR|nr:hypothetical protein BDN72DRAFT_926618 [Pluteus cervinus]